MIARIRSQHAKANASPSVALEKGAYRLHAPSSYKRQPRRTGQQRSLGRAFGTRRLVVLLLLLVIACLSSFGLAYYLYTSRWEAHTPHVPRSADEMPRTTTVGGIEHGRLARGNEKCLAYLPHSGFHNQRIAFENALILARLLNRTLIVPPIRLSERPISYHPFDTLSRVLAQSSKVGLRHCPKIPAYMTLPPECTGYFDYTHISWNWLLNMSQVSSRQPLLPAWDFTRQWIYDTIDISASDVLIIRDRSLYHFRYTDSANHTTFALGKYEEAISISDLAVSTARVIHLGTLFGSSRLHLKKQKHRAIREEIRRSMSFSNSFLLKLVKEVISELRPSFYGVHIRIGDGRFLKNRVHNIRTIWRTLLQTAFDYSSDEIIQMENDFWSVAKPTDNLTLLTLADGVAPHGRILEPFKDVMNSGRPRCRALHRRDHLMPLNAPLYISTDAPEDLSDPLFVGFYNAFPCAFRLSDFPHVIGLLDQLRNDDDGVKLGPFLHSFIDAMVLGHAERVVVTENSTYSQFVHDVLWRIYHDNPILQRG